MRKLLLIGMLAVSTLAWAHGAKKGGDQSRAGNDFYQATLNTQVEQFVRLNKTGTPSSALAENAPFQAPGSMAARQGAGGDDWYNQRLKIATDVRQRDLGALKGASGLSMKAKKK